MGRQEINVIVTVKSLEELVFQVAPIAKAKLEKISSLKPGKMVLKSHVECDLCNHNMEVNFFWTHALSVSQDSVKNAQDTKFFVEEVVKIEPLEEIVEPDEEGFEYEEEYLIEDEQLHPQQHQLPETDVYMLKEEQQLDEVLLDEEEEVEAMEGTPEEPEEVEIEEEIMEVPSQFTDKLLIPENEICRGMEETGVCDYCGYARRRSNVMICRNSFFMHCASHLIQKRDSMYTCLACGLPSRMINEARYHALSCEERASFRDEWERTSKERVEKFAATPTPREYRKYNRPKVLCHICSKYVYKQSLREHMMKHEVGSALPFECNECGKFFSSRDNVRKHLVVHHFPDLARYKCPHCPAVFAQKHFYDTHVMAKHKIGDLEKVTCLVCGLVVANERNLKEHNFNMHVDPSAKRQFHCDLCSKVFYDKRHHKAHMLIHLPEEERPYKCQKCGKRFVSTYKYKQHVLEHENPELILRKCEICGKGYKYANSLKVHMRVHTGEQPYECKFCNRRFADRSHHRVHMKGHESEMGIKLTLTAEERRLVNHGVYQPEELISQVLIE